MGCGPGAAGKIRSVGVFVVSIIFSTRMPGSITRENMAPRIRAATAAAITQRLVPAFTSLLGDVISNTGRSRPVRFIYSRYSSPNCSNIIFFRRLAHGYHELMNFSGGCDGPVAVFEFAEHPGYRNRAELPAVPSHVPVIAHDEAFIFGHGDFRKIGRRMALRDKNAILSTVVVFIENLTGCSRNGARPNGFQRKLYAVHINIAIFDRHRITGERHDAFDPKFTAIIWICKQNE